MKKMITTIGVCLAAALALGQGGSSTIKGRIGGAAATESGSSTIKGRVGGAAATDAGTQVPTGGGPAGESTRAGLSGDAFSSPAGIAGGTNILGATTNGFGTNDTLMPFPHGMITNTP